MRTTRTRRTGAGAALALAAGTLAAVGTTPASADHGTPFPTTTGIYRIPYADGTELHVIGDNHNHGGDGGNRNRVDLQAFDDDQLIVAAASGWVRRVVDRHGDTNDAGDGLDVNGNPYPDPDDDALEHLCTDNTQVPADCQDYNNYVWIEHPNGEWTKYSHPGTGTVPDAVRPDPTDPDDGVWVEAGTVLGVEDNIGFAFSTHLHHEAAAPPVLFTELNPGQDGGFVSNTLNRAIVVCDIGGTDLYEDDDPDAGNDGNDDDGNDDLVAAPCNHLPPTAAAGGPYQVAEGSGIVLAGGDSSDPDGNPLTYAWRDTADPDDRTVTTTVDDPRTAAPTYAGIDDGSTDLTLFVYDQIEQLPDSDTTTVTVLNVAPTVTAVGDTVDEAGAATVSATFVDPGTEDTHIATVDWGDGSPSAAVTTGDLAAGVDHVYGDNGTFDVTVTVTDDDGGVGQDTVPVEVANVDPTLALDTSGAVSFPGGDYQVVEHGVGLQASADGSDPGSDDLTFSWSTGDQSTYFNDGIGPDPFPSPFGDFPFLAGDAVDVQFAAPGVETLTVQLTDDDAGTDTAEAGVLVTGTEVETRGDGWWKHQYAGTGDPQVDEATLAGYLEIVGAVSSVFSEQTGVATPTAAHAVLSPTGDDRRARAESALLTAWLQFASGAVDHDATVPLHGSGSAAFLDLLFAAEAVIGDGGASTDQLHSVTQDLDRVRHAS